jgi:acyl dehydratase
VSAQTAETLPVYDWERAAVGDAADPVVVELTAAHLATYARAQRIPDAHAAGPLPPVMVRVYAPLRRRELVAQMGTAYPAHPTPAVKWSCRQLAPIQVGERIRSVTRVAGKYERNGRRFLHWEVAAEREGDGTQVALFGYVNLWDRGRPEDRQRAVASAVAPPGTGKDVVPITQRPPRLADIAAGSHVPPRTWTATMEDMVAFGDFLYPARADNPTRAGNPHLDVEYARKHLYGGLIVDGNQTVAQLWELVRDWIPADAALTHETEVEVRFPNPCREGDIVGLAATVESVSDTAGGSAIRFNVNAHNAAGQCLASGSIALVASDVTASKEN